ncbi:tetratricopeptide repeat protein [Treponema sp.]|uniref:tetratricopeptide repeat protein n=1 Tax=Treponema sp. TaxID=166 RepID=UPI00388FF122
MNKIKKFLAWALALLCPVLSVFATELTFRVTPGMVFPFLTGGNTRYSSVGFFGIADAGVDLGAVNAGLEFGYYALPKNNSSNLSSGKDKIVSFVPLGFQVSTTFFPFSRIESDVGVAGGVALTMTNGMNHYAPWYRAFGELSYRINPNISVGGSLSWFSFQYDSYWGNPGASGVTAGVSIKYKFDTENIFHDVIASVNQQESVFPLFYTVYKNNPFGTISITNEETAEIRNVRVLFRAKRYTNSDIECGTINLIRKHKTAEVSIVADFAESILQFSEAGKIPGEIVVEYELLGQQRTAISQVIIPVYNRNQVRWTDQSVLASYISATSDEVLELSKVLSGIARSHLRSGLNRNMQFAMYIFNGMGLGGITLANDTTTPYKDYHVDPSLLDYIQYPFQTIMYKSGDVDELGILYMALLQASNIPAAFIPLEDDFIVCFNLGVNASKAGNFFDGFDRILVIDDEIWIPLSMSSLREGFINSWYRGIISLQQCEEDGVEFEFTSISEAWKSYPPAGFSTGTIARLSINEKNLISSAETEISRYVTAEFGPQIAAVQNRIKAEGASVQLYNKLGMLYVRAGMYSSAKPVYEMSAKMGSVSAMTNLGNIYSLQKNFKEARKWYQMAIELEPDNKTALKNLARIESDLE